jgi:preprotein translocase subunit SecB
MAESPPERPLVIHSQYIKDLSFENPNAPEIFAALSEQGPALNITLDVQSRHLTERTYEIVLLLRVQATVQEKTTFLVELDYAGVVKVDNATAEADLEPLLMIEAPRYFFPFARNVLATITRDGGFPPLVINPIDFEQFYARHKKGALQAVAAQA